MNPLPNDMWILQKLPLDMSSNMKSFCELSSHRGCCKLPLSNSRYWPGVQIYLILKKRIFISQGPGLVFRKKLKPMDKSGVMNFYHFFVIFKSRPKYHRVAVSHQTNAVY
jgi:hypothetical protein